MYFIITLLALKFKKRLFNLMYSSLFIMPSYVTYMSRFIPYAKYLSCICNKTIFREPSYISNNVVLTHID